MSLYTLGNFFEDSMSFDHDYVFFSPPDYEDLKIMGVNKRYPESYRRSFLELLIPRLHPTLGTITVAFTGARRHASRIYPKTFYLQEAMFKFGYYLRDVKVAMKSRSYNGYSHQNIDILTFQHKKIKGLYNLRKDKLYDTYGKDCWGPFKKEQKIEGEVVGQPIEIAEYCIANFTNVDHVVLDPFAGIATTCVAALRNDRRYHGYEIRKKIWSIGCHRLDEAACETYI